MKAVYARTTDTRLAGAERKLRFLERRSQLPERHPDYAAEVIPYSVSGALTAHDGGLRFYALAGGRIRQVHVSVGTAPAGSGLTVRINRNGSSIGTVTIAAGDHTATFTPSPAGYSAGDYFTVDITAVGSSTAGSDLVVELQTDES